MDTNNQLTMLYGAAMEQQDAVKAAMDGLAQERAKLVATIGALKNASSGLQTATGAAASKAVIDSLAQAPKTAVEALSAATEALDNAAKRVRNAGAWISWKFALMFAFAGVAAVATNYAIGRFTLPDRAEIEALRSEKAELETNIADLAKRGGRIKLSICGPNSRLCVQITPKQGTASMQTDFQGSWVNIDGRKHFVIPQGY